MQANGPRWEPDERLRNTLERVIEAPVRKRVPDRVLCKANQIELGDSSPEQLRRRMTQGAAIDVHIIARRDPARAHTKITEAAKES
jgi:K+-sensing histidine kinase KdpD